MYLYRLNMTNVNLTGSDPSINWYLFRTLSSLSGQNTFFGHSVDIWGNTLIVGAKGYEPLVYKSGAVQKVNNTGWAFIYDFNATENEWTMSQKLTSPVGQNSYFGQSVAIKDNSIIVGADGFRECLRNFFALVFADSVISQPSATSLALRSRTSAT